MTERPVQHLIQAGYNLQLQDLNISNLLQAALNVPNSTIRHDCAQHCRTLLDWYPTTKS
jgi:hypothetical protein